MNRSYMISYAQIGLGLLLLTLLLFGNPSNALAGELSEVTAASDNARATIDKAIADKDSGLLASLFTSGAAIITPNGYTVSGRLKIRMAAKMIMLTGETGKIEAKRKTMTIIDGLAYETGSYSFRPTGSKSSKAKQVVGSYTIIWRLEDKIWKIHRAIGI